MLVGAGPRHGLSCSTSQTAVQAWNVDAAPLLLPLAWHQPGVACDCYWLAQIRYLERYAKQKGGPAHPSAVLKVDADGVALGQVRPCARPPAIALGQAKVSRLCLDLHRTGLQLPSCCGHCPSAALGREAA